MLFQIKRLKLVKTAKISCYDKIILGHFEIRGKQQYEIQTEKTALVTGGSSGIGRCTASALSQSGYTVYEFSRRDIPIKGVKHMSVDVTDEASVQAAVEQILRERGSIDILVNCAGFGISGAVEFTELKQAKAQFDVNFLELSM